MRRAIALVAVAAGLVVLLVLGAGCGGGSSAGSPSAAASPQWDQVLTTEVSGAQPVKLNLGAHDLGPAVRLGWVLTGPSTAPPVVMTFRIINQTNGVGYGHSVTPKDAGFSLDNDSAIVLAPIWKGDYLIYFSQRFPQHKGPGYDAKLTVWTQK